MKLWGRIVRMPGPRNQRVGIRIRTTPICVFDVDPVRIQGVLRMNARVRIHFRHPSNGNLYTVETV